MIISKKVIRNKNFKEKVAFNIFRAFSAIVVLSLVAILSFIIYNGISVINWTFLTAMPEDGMTKGGIFPAIVGTLCLVAGSMIFAFPIGILSGIYINEYLTDNWL